MAIERASSIQESCMRAQVKHNEAMLRFGSPVINDATIHTVLNSLKDKMDDLTKGLVASLHRMETRR